MEHPFDELTKALAEGRSRREVVRGAIGVFGTVLLGALGWADPASAAPKACVAICKQYRRGSQARKHCLSECTACKQQPGSKVCKTTRRGRVEGICCLKDEKCCGQIRCCQPGETCCLPSYGVCRDLQNDDANCGRCRNQCPAGKVCVAGVCQTVCTGSGQTPCHATGGAVDCCEPEEYCSEGVCVEGCPPGKTACLSRDGEYFGCCDPGQFCDWGDCINCPAGMSLCQPANPGERHSCCVFDPPNGICCPNMTQPPGGSTFCPAQNGQNLICCGPGFCGATQTCVNGGCVNP